jgi:hypothetical protein
VQITIVKAPIGRAVRAYGDVGVPRADVKADPGALCHTPQSRIKAQMPSLQIAGYVIPL